MNKRLSKLLPGLLLAAATLLPTAVFAQGPGMGPGMMGPGSGPYHEGERPYYGRGYHRYGGYGMGPGMMGGYGGYGMGPGMMGGYGGYGMGPGMMGGYGGYGMGPGMMGGYGMMGPGMMYGPGYGIDLNDKQRQAFVKIQQQTMQKNWEIMGKMREQMLQLQELYGADTVDPKAVGKVYDRITALRKQMFENSIEAHNQMREHLTKEQRERWQNMRRGMGWGPGMMYDE